MALSHLNRNSWIVAAGGSGLAIASLFTVAWASYQSMTQLEASPESTQNHPVHLNRVDPLQAFFPDLDAVEYQLDIALYRREALRTQNILRFVEVNTALGDTSEDIVDAYVAAVARNEDPAGRGAESRQAPLPVQR